MRWLDIVKGWILGNEEGVPHVTPPKPKCYLDVFTPVDRKKDCCDDCVWLDDCWQHTNETLDIMRRTYYGRSKGEENSKRY